MRDFDPIECRIFEAVVGSNLYGTATPESDMDYRGVCIPPMNVLLNPFMPFEQKDSGFEEEDRAIYALGKFLKTCADANPNIIELLFIPESKIIYNTKYWDKIGEDLFFDLMELKKADICAHSENSQYQLPIVEEMIQIGNQILENRECFSLKDLAINGHDLIDIGYAEGRILGKTLDDILQIVIDGFLKNEREILLEFAKTIR
jgi:hypothetical protein